MIETRITPENLRDMLLHAADKVCREESRLNALDAAVGDGDHGVTMRIGFEAIRQKLIGLQDNLTLNSVLNEAGVAFMGATGGAIGIILARMLMVGGMSLQNRATMGPAEFRTLVDSMEIAASQAGKARPGDKTIVDAVHAANTALESCAKNHKSLAECISQAAAAADRAARETSHLICRIGRASRLGNRARGHPDPGATSFAVILNAFAEWVRENLEKDEERGSRG